VIEKLREKQERATKIAEDLRINNASLAKSLSAKDRKIVDLEKALAEQGEASKRNTSEILEKLKLLYVEYQKSLNEYGVRPAPLPDDIDIPDFMDWLGAEFKALTEVITGASNFAVGFSVESILKILHDYDCVDLEKFRANLSEFPSATSTAILRANSDVQAIKIKFAREFWLTGGQEVVKTIAQAKLGEVVSFVRFHDLRLSQMFQFFFKPSSLFAFLSQLNEEENQQGTAACPEGSTSGEGSSESGEDSSGGSSSSSSSSSDDGNGGEQVTEREGDSPKVDVTN
jgi:hypothetical protein